MEIKKKLDVFPVTTDGERISEGDILVFSTNDNRCCIGEFKGISDRGAIKLMGLVGGANFNVLPKSIDTVFKADVKLLNNEEEDKNV